MNYSNSPQPQRTPNGRNVLWAIILVIFAIVVVFLLISGRGFQIAEYVVNLVSGRESYR